MALYLHPNGVMNYLSTVAVSGNFIDICDQLEWKDASIHSPYLVYCMKQLLPATVY